MKHVGDGHERSYLERVKRESFLTGDMFNERRFYFGAEEATIMFGGCVVCFTHPVENSTPLRIIGLFRNGINDVIVVVVWH